MSATQGSVESAAPLLGEHTEEVLSNPFRSFRQVGTIQKIGERKAASKKLTKPLKHIRIIELAHYTSGPFGTRHLANLGAEVIVAVKAGPVLNDALLQDAEAVGMDKVADKVMTTGADSVGLFVSECSKEFLDLYRSVDFVVAKGMGHAETLTGVELPVSHALLLRSKCSTVAKHFGVQTGKNIAKLLN